MDDDLLVSKAVLSRISWEAAAHAATPQPAACLFLCAGNGDVTMQGSYQPTYAEKLIGHFLVRALNRRINQKGRWVTAWTDGGRLFLMIWLDPDGDPQFTVECEEDAVGMAEVGADHWINQAYDAWALWKKHMIDVLEPSANQTFKRAQGERPSSGKHGALIDLDL